jgi:hypothetical protein
MFRRFAIWLTLGCYGVIALAGQGLHSFVCEHGDHHAQAKAISGAERTVIESDDGDCCHHDPDSCAICQHHSLGQIFVAAPPVEIVLAVCEHLSPPAPEVVYCPALVSPAQPRAPPTVA